jgi:hypothetical protein
MRKPATRLSFPKLLDRVNAGLTSPLEFVQEFLSIQTVRNSLEHRNGIVGKQDLDDGGSTLTLTFPRWKFFYMRGEEEIEIAPGEPVDAQNGQPLVDILGRLTTVICLGRTDHFHARGIQRNSNGLRPFRIRVGSQIAHAFCAKVTWCIRSSGASNASSPQTRVAGLGATRN